MEYLLDTVTLVRYLTKQGKIPKKVFNIFEQAERNESTLFVSTISLMEILYLGEKNKIGITVKKTIESISASNLYKIIDLTSDIILEACKIDFYELHDRMILATAKYLDVPVISPDKKFKEVKGVNIIW